MSNYIETWMFKETFNFFQVGLRKLFSILKEYEDVINRLELKKMSFDNDIEKLKKVINWTVQVNIANESDNVTFVCSKETIEVLKAGGVAQIILLERERDKLKKDNAPKLLIDNVNEKLTQYREKIDIGVFKEINPDSIIEYLYEPEPNYEDKNINEDNHYEYDIALSFAGEDRKYAEEIAKALSKKNISVFYDSFEQSSLWGVDLYTHLSSVYKDKARFCLMFLSKDYAQKAWTTHERKSAQARAFIEQREYILPIRIDDTEIPGIPLTVGYIDINQFTTEDIVSMILDKLKNIK